MNLIEDKKHITATVINVNWERVNLYIDVKIEFNTEDYKNSKLDFFAVNTEYIAKAKFNVENLENGVYRLHINITNPGYNSCLPRGVYRIFVCSGEDKLTQCVSSTDIVKKMADFSRAFIYNKRSNAYNVAFYVDDSDDNVLPFIMQTMESCVISNFKVNPISLSPKEILKPSPFYKVICKKIIEKIMGKNRQKSEEIKRKFRRKYYSIMSKNLKPTDKTILFMSQQNPSITANQKAVYDKMVQRGLDKEWNIMFSFDSIDNENQTEKSWYKLIKMIAKSSIIILDDYAPVFNWLKLNKNTKLIQLWHAGAGFKSSGYSRWGGFGGPNPYCCHRQYTYGIAGSKKIAEFHSEVWGINIEQIIPTGMPKLDEYFDETHKKNTIQKLYNDYPICKGKKVILFAPTYRGQNKVQAHYPYNLIDFDAFYKLCANEYVVLFKSHPWIADPVPIPENYKDKFIDVGKYPNINDLFYITDLLITDYSSNVYEYSVMCKPMLFFAYDEIQYSFSRGFHRDYKESTPGKIVHTFEELLEAIKNKDFEYEKVEKYAKEHFDYFDSGASDRVIDWLILGNIPEEYKLAIDKKFEEVADMVKRDFEPEK